MAEHDPVLCGISTDCPGCKADDLAGQFERAVLAARNVRDSMLSDAFIEIIYIAAERHPDRLRAMLASVFDVAGIAAMNERQAVLTAENQRQAALLADQVNNLARAVEDLAKRLDGLDMQMDALAIRLGKARKYMVWLRDRCKAVFEWASKQKGFQARPAPRPAAPKDSKPLSKG